MNSLTKNFGDLGAKMKAGTESLKQKGEAMKANVIEKAMANKVDTNGYEDPSVSADAALAVPSVVEAPDSTANGASTNVHTDTPSKPSLKDTFTEFTSQFKRVEEPVEISDLLEVLSALFEVDPRAKEPHEMVQALDIQGIHTWRSFLLMAEEDIPLLTKHSKDGGDVPLSYNSIRMLTYLKQFTKHNINTGVDFAKDPDLYKDPQAFDAYVEDLQFGRKNAVGQEPEEEEEAKPNKINENVRASLTAVKGFASKIKADTSNAAQQGSASINDILAKTKAKVLRKDRASSSSNGSLVGNVSADDGSVGASSVGMSSVTEGGNSSSNELSNVPHDIAFENMKKNVDELAQKLETTARNVTNKVEAQKLMLPLLTNLKKSQDKFAALKEARRKKKEDKEAEAADPAADADSAAATVDDNNNNKLKNLMHATQSKTKEALSHAEHATKRALENAEQIARQAARKAGILDDDKDESGAPAAVGEPTAAAPESPPPPVPVPTADGGVTA